MTGSVRSRSKGSWELKFDVGTDPLTGRRITKYSTFKGTKRAAEIELARLVTAAEKGEYIDPSKLTVAEFLKRWIEDWVTPNVSPKTAEGYQSLINNHVNPHIGAARIQKLRAVDFVTLYGKLAKAATGRRKALAPRTIGHVHRVLHNAFKQAAEWGVIVVNPVVNVDPPRVQSREIEILTADQVKDVLTKLRSEPIYSIAALALATGMRRGELLALRWGDVDLDGAKLRVEQSLEETGAGLRLKEPKTRCGRRAITLPGWIVTELRTLRKATQENRLKLGIGKLSEDALVFGTIEGLPRSPDAVSKVWASTLARLKLPKVTMHSLRHTHASQLIAAGLDVLTISRRLGHGTPTITLSVYGHMFANTDDRAAAIIDAAFRDSAAE